MNNSNKDKLLDITIDYQQQVYKILLEKLRTAKLIKDNSQSKSALHFDIGNGVVAVFIHSNTSRATLRYYICGFEFEYLKIKQQEWLYRLMLKRGFFR